MLDGFICLSINSSIRGISLDMFANVYCCKGAREQKKQICDYKCRIFPRVLVQCPFDLLTVTFQGQTFFDSL